MRRVVLLLAAVLLLAQDAQGGDAVTGFQPGKPLPPEALRHLQVKAVIAEFLDPDQTGLGKELGYLVWREILTAVSDQRGAGVIIAHTPGKERLVDLLQQSYHQAALQIAESQKARMAVWGAISEQGGTVFIDSYLSLIGETTRDELALRLASAAGPGQKPRDTGLVARISRTRFNFPRVVTTRDQLFVRPLLVQTSTPVRERAGAGRTLATARANESLQADGMEGEWFRVRLAGGARGYVRSWDVHVPPRQIEVLDDQPLSAQPAPTAARMGRATKNTAYPVLASHYGSKVGLWYRITTPSGDGWVAAARARTRFSLPVVHFVAGLYRYQLGRYKDAAREFEQFTRSERATSDAPSLSTAYQLLGASQLMDISTSGRDVYRSSPEPARAFDRAIAVTPFDAGAYTLRAVSTLAVQGSVRDALSDVTKALTYDADHTDARTTLARMRTLSSGGDPSLPMRLREDVRREGLGDRIDELARKYEVKTR